MSPKPRKQAPRSFLQGSVSIPRFGSTPTLVFYCVIVGIVGAFAALAFDFLVDLAQRWMIGGIGGYAEAGLGQAARIPHGTARWWLPLVTTLGGLLSGFLVFRWAPEAEGHGTDAAIAAYHRRGGDVQPRVSFIKAIASALTIGSGGVAGREGPTAQIVVGLGSALARLTGLRGEQRRSLLLASMAAGLAAMFRAPLGMAIFSVEVLYSGMVFESEALIYTVIAAVTAYACFGFFEGWDALFHIPKDIAFHEPASLISFAALGILAGIMGAILPTLLYRIKDLFARLPGPRALRPALGGLCVGLIAMIAPEVLGTGYGWTQLAITGGLSLSTVLLLLLLKAPAMALTIGSGGSGGVFAPTVTVGAMLGAAVGLSFAGLPLHSEMPLGAYVVVGMAAIFAGAARTPISALIMVAEMTGGYGLIVPAMLTNMLSFLVQRALTHGRTYQTLYEAQVERREDSPLHRGVFVRRALEMVDSGDLEADDLTLPRLVSLLRFGEPIPIGEHQGSLVLLDIAEGSLLAGQTIEKGVGGVAGATAVAILRQDELVVPRGASRIRAGDQLMLVTLPAARETLARAALPTAPPAGTPTPANAVP
jgi:CIC family chloride channel protein